MDIGNQQRVIIVELDETSAEEPVAPVEAASGSEQDLELAAAWPLPLDLDPEPVG